MFKTINITITQIISVQSKAYNISLSNKNIEIDNILIFRNDKYKVTNKDRYGIDAFRILKNSISKSKYIHIDKDLTILTEKMKKKVSKISKGI